MKHTFFLTLLGLISVGAMAQVTLRGKVTTLENKPLAGANVVVNNPKSGTVTDLNGAFSLADLTRNQELTLTVSFLGYKPEQRRLTLASDDFITIQLEEHAITTQEIIVSATRARENTPTSHQTMDLTKIKETNTGQEIPYLLQLTPSLVATSDAGTGIGYSSFRIRGTDLTRINVTVNDVPLNDAESHGVFWVNMPDFTESVNSIQIQRGVGTSSNGAAAFGASVNLQTNALEKESYAEANNVFGSFNTRKHTLKAGTGLMANNFAFDLRLSQITSDGFIDRAFADMKSFYFSGGYYSDKHILKTNIFSGKEITYQAWEGVPKVKLQNDTAGMRRFANESGYSPEETENLFNSNARTFNKYLYHNQTDNYKQDHYQVFYTYNHSSNLKANLALHLTEGFGYYESYRFSKKLSGFGLSDMQIGDTLVRRTDLINRKFLDNDFYGAVASVNYKNDLLDITMGGGANRYDGHHFGTIIWSQFNNGSISPDHEYYRNQAVKDDANAYVRASLKISDMIDFYGDIQLRGIKYNIDGFDDDNRDVTQKHSFLFFNPKAGFFVHKDNFSGFVSLAQAHREPTRSNYTDADSAKGIPTQEKLLDWEAGLGYKNEFFSAQVNFFHMQYRDQLVLTGNVNDVGSPIMENVDNSFRQGIELSVGLKLSDKLEWTGLATFSRNKIENFVAYFDDWDTWGQRIDTVGSTNIAFSPSVVLGSVLTVKPLKELSLTLTDNFVGKQYIDNTSNKNRQLDSYWVTNVRVNYATELWKVNASFFAQINNLYNVEYSSNAWVYSYYYENEQRAMDGYFPQAGRHFMVGLNVRF